MASIKKLCNDRYDPNKLGTQITPTPAPTPALAPALATLAPAQASASASGQRRLQMLMKQGFIKPNQPIVSASGPSAPAQSLAPTPVPAVPAAPAPAPAPAPAQKFTEPIERLKSYSRFIEGHMPGKMPTYSRNCLEKTDNRSHIRQINSMIGIEQYRMKLLN